LLWGAIIGAAISACLGAVYWIFDATFSLFEVMLWPTSIIMMALEAKRPPTEGVVIVPRTSLMSPSLP